MEPDKGEKTPATEINMNLESWRTMHAARLAYEKDKREKAAIKDVLEKQAAGVPVSKGPQS